MSGAPEPARPGFVAVGFDPGLAETGFAALVGGRAGVGVLGSGVIRTPPGDPLEARLEQLFEKVHGVLESYSPDLVVVEDVFSAAAVPRTAILMGHARAVICLAGRQRKVAMLTVAPAEVKRAVTAWGMAPKAQVARAMQVLLGLPGAPRPSHVADALALAFTGLTRARNFR